MANLLIVTFAATWENTPECLTRLRESVERYFTTVNWKRNDIDLPNGSFVTNLVRPS